MNETKPPSTAIDLHDLPPLAGLRENVSVMLDQVARFKRQMEAERAAGVYRRPGCRALAADSAILTTQAEAEAEWSTAPCQEFGRAFFYSCSPAAFSHICQFCSSAVLASSQLTACHASQARAELQSQYTVSSATAVRARRSNSKPL